MHKIYTCKYFAIWSKYTHISKSIFNLRSHAYSVHISILKVTLDQLYFDSSHVQTGKLKNRCDSCHFICVLGWPLGCLMRKVFGRNSDLKSGGLT